MTTKASKMSDGPITADNARVQLGRIMVVLKDASVQDEVIFHIASKHGQVVELHRPKHNMQFAFIQFLDHSDALRALDALRNYPIFKAVDPAVRSDRFQKDDNDSNDNQFKKSKNIKDGQHVRNKRELSSEKTDNAFQTNNASNNNNMGFNNLKFPLGCQYCTKMPSFECQCGAFYCNISCQRAHFAEHRNNCLPRLVPISYSNKRIIEESIMNSTLNALTQQLHQPTHQQPQQSYRQQQQDGINKQQKQSDQGHNQQQSQQKPQSQQQNRQNRDNKKVGNKRQQSDNNPDKSNTNSDQSKQTKDLNKSSNEKAEVSIKKEGQHNGIHNKSDQSDITDNHQKSTEDLSSKPKHLVNKLQMLKLSKSSQPRVLLPGQFPPTNSRVKITATLPAGVIYIYHNNAKGTESSDYQLLANRVYKATAAAKLLTVAPQVGDVIFAPFQGEYYRGKVLSVEPGDKVKVQYVDFGNTETVMWKQSKVIDDEQLQWAKYLAFPVRLEGIDHFTITMQEFLAEMEGTEDFELFSAKALPNSALKEVVLKLPKQSTTLNMQLQEINEKEHRLRKQEEKERQQKAEQERREQEEKQKSLPAVKIPDPSTYQPILYDEVMETTQLMKNTRQEMIIIDASEVVETCIVSVIATKDAQKYAMVVDDCEKYGKADTNQYQPTLEGEVCLVLHHNDWSRALYDKSENNFMLLDIGIITHIPPANVRRFPSGLSPIVYNNEVVVDNIGALKEVIRDGESNVLHGKIIEAFVSMNEDTYTIKITKVK